MGLISCMAAPKDGGSQKMAYSQDNAVTEQADK
jgi:hypothetical protein